ncbi:alpha/beta hydrolase [Ligilactobacillus hayakitensis]|nr:alpha/beta hydrolase [Ligilactobacillus hayakitensis]
MAYYQQQTFENTSHSSLHDNKRILNEISDILWKNK